MKTKTQNGNVLFYILIAIVLFSALGFAVSSSMRGGGNMLTDEMLELQANEILSYAGKMKETVQSLQLINDCSDTDISFESTEWGHTDYDNGSAPDECKVFDPNGGRLRWSSPDDSITTSEWEYWSNVRIAGVGNSDNDADSVDLIMVLPDLSQDMCNTLNQKINGANAPDDRGDVIDGTLGRFNGTYTPQENITGTTEAGNCENPNAKLCAKTSGCFREELSGQLYIFYQALIAR